MEAHGEKTFVSESRGAPDGGSYHPNENSERSGINIKSAAPLVTAPGPGSCPTGSLVMGGRSCSPNPAIHRSRGCPSPISSIVGTALNQ